MAGLLSLFMDNFAGGYDLPHRLWLAPPGTSLHPLTPPSPVESGLFGDLPPHSLELHPGVDVPRWYNEDHAVVIDGLIEAEQAAYDEEFTWALGPGSQARVVGKLFGHVAGIGGDPREDAVVWEEAPGRTYDSAVTRDICREGARHSE